MILKVSVIHVIGVDFKVMASVKLCLRGDHYIYENHICNMNI